MSGEMRDPLGPDQEGVLPLGMEGETLVSRFLPGGNIQAETVAGTNVVSGAQHIEQQHIHVHGVPGQPRIPPLLRPRRAEHFQDRAAE